MSTLKSLPGAGGEKLNGGYQRAGSTVHNDSGGGGGGCLTDHLARALIITSDADQMSGPYPKGQ